MGESFCVKTYHSLFLNSNRMRRSQWKLCQQTFFNPAFVALEQHRISFNPFKLHLNSISDKNRFWVDGGGRRDFNARPARVLFLVLIDLRPQTIFWKARNRKRTETGQDRSTEIRTRASSWKPSMMDLQGSPRLWRERFWETSGKLSVYNFDRTISLRNIVPKISPI